MATAPDVGDARLAPVADQQTAHMVSILAPSGRSRAAARLRITERHLDATDGDLWLAECRVLAEDRHSLGTLSAAHNWLTRHPLTPETMPLGVNGPELFEVESGNPETLGTLYRVIYLPESETYRCSCPLRGHYGAPCHHIGAVHELVRQVRASTSAAGAAGQRREDALAEDLDTRRGWQ